MNREPDFYQLAPQTSGLERLVVREDSNDWARLRDLLQHDLEVLDTPVFTALPTSRSRAGSNRGGNVHLFTYRVYEPATNSGIDPVVCGVLISPGADGESFRVTGDISGESRGDVLFEIPNRAVVGWT